MRAVSASIWRRAAPELALSRSASRRSWFLASSVTVCSAISRVSAAVASSFVASSDSMASSFVCSSASSRLRASGPCSRGLPPVTVTLWKVSPLGERKNAWGCCAARRRAVALSGAM